MHDRIVVPDGDVLIHAGDQTDMGRPDEIFEFYAWLSKQPHGRIIAIPGNHDFGFQKIPYLLDTIRSTFPRVETLLDSETTIDGLRVWGSPWQPWFHDWAYNFSPGEKGRYEARNKWDQIPDDTAILITHGPSYGVLDKTLGGHHVGCSALNARIAQLQDLRLHVCGHIHEGYGTQHVGNVLHVNACICDRSYEPVQMPWVLDIVGGQVQIGKEG